MSVTCFSSWFFFTLFFTVKVFANQPTPRFLVHILDYITVDYSGAVQNGKVISKDEYAEQREFSQSLLQMAKQLPELSRNPEILANLESLDGLILAKADAKKVEVAARTAGNQIMRLKSFETAPRRWPNRVHGKEVYEGSCAACHGNSGHGDGPSSGNLEPKPANFFAEKASKVSPFQMFNAIRLGVPGTAMASFDALSDQDVWDLTFYLSSLRHPAPTEKLADPYISLEELSTSSDERLSVEKKLSAEAIASLRHYLPETSEVSFIELARQGILKSKEAYMAGNFESARQLAIAAYLDGVEPVEPSLRNRDPRITPAIEVGMATLRGAMDRREPVERVVASVEALLPMLKEAEKLLEEKETSPWMAFLLSAGIVLREALEAILILITLLGVIHSLKLKAAARYVHAGWVSALIVGGLAWIFSGWLMRVSGAQRELLEGVVSALAVGVLLYFGFWLHKHSEIGKWHTFINDLVKNAVNRRNLMILGVAAFMGVFREAFETVLFLRALVLEVGKNHEPMVGLGVLTSFVIVVLFSVFAVKTSANLPLRKLFTLSSVVVVFLSFVLLGKAIHSFQESGLLGMTHLPWPIRWEMAGLYPTFETFIPQLVLLLAVFAYLLFFRRFSESSEVTGSI